MMQTSAVQRCGAARPRHAFTTSVPRAHAAVAVPCRPGRPGRLPVTPVRATVTVKDEKTGVEFPVAQKFWEGDVFRCLGAGCREKKILVVNVQIYSAALYVEAKHAARELGVRQRGGFFSSDDDFAEAVLDGAFHKVLVIHLVRDVTGEQFVDALNKTLVPRLQLSGEMDKLKEFQDFLGSKQLKANTEVVLFWNTVGDLEVLLAPPLKDPAREFDQVKPELRIRSPSMGRALFEIFLGSNSVVVEARKAWIQGAKLLLESDNVTRASRKSGA